MNIKEFKTFSLIFKTNKESDVYRPIYFEFECFDPMAERLIPLTTIDGKVKTGCLLKFTKNHCWPITKMFARPRGDLGIKLGKHIMLPHVPVMYLLHSNLKNVIFLYGKQLCYGYG